MISKLYKVQQTFCYDLVENVREEVLNKLADSGVTVNKGASIAIAVGSRGYSQYTSHSEDCCRLGTRTGWKPVYSAGNGQPRQRHS